LDSVGATLFGVPPVDGDDGEPDGGGLLEADEPDPEQPAVTAATSARPTNADVRTCAAMPTALQKGALGPDGRTLDARSGSVNALLADG
jgi:hypothetical protein